MRHSNSLCSAVKQVPDNQLKRAKDWATVQDTAAHQQMEPLDD